VGIRARAFVRAGVSMRSGILVFAKTVKKLIQKNYILLRVVYTAVRTNSNERIARKELNVNRSPSVTSGLGWTEDQNVKPFPAIRTRYL